MLVRSPPIKLPASARRRRHPRLDVQCKMMAYTQGRHFPLTSTDLSFGGAFFDTDEPLSLGMMLEIELHSRHCQARSTARVVHQSDRGIGVTFVDPASGFVDALYEVIFEHIAKNAEQEDDYERIPGRIMVNVRCEEGFYGLFTCALGLEDLWVLIEPSVTFPQTFWITISEYGVFDCQVQILWRTEAAMGLELIDPSTNFINAYGRLRASFLESANHFV